MEAVYVESSYNSAEQMCNACCVRPRWQPRQVPADAEIGQKRLRCRSEKRSRETPVTLPAAVKPPAGSLSNPLAALGGWIGQLAPRAAGARRAAYRA